MKLIIACVVLFALQGALAHAQPASPEDRFPTKPIRLIFPTSVGSGSDVLGRVIAEQMRVHLGQPVVIENRPGAAGVIGVTAAKNAAPDGYTLVFGNLSSIVMAPLLVVPQPYDPVNDFDAVAAVYRVLITFSANASVPAHNLRQLVDYAKKNPNKLNYSSAGPGSFAHLWVELLKRRQGLEMVHVPYKGAGPAFQALLAGEAQVNVAETFTMGAGANSPHIRILAQLGEQRGSGLPDVQTVREAGFPDLASDFWFGFIAPRGTPPGIVRRLNEEINRAMASADVKSRIAAAGGEAIAANAAIYASMIASDTRTWTPIVRELGLAGK
jgi:tripartite-type tricarboxylate transporter receptor subunit TctC